MYALYITEDEQVIFSKDHLCQQIETGGGQVLDKFDTDLVSQPT